eukprot:GFUD01128262.1.p1 GENE.GFUD01128262.1~~GFUD01128262.1.p1  ORF type:complete len:142 (+),score=26.32 GFUD01128262.1:36-428(+)
MYQKRIPEVKFTRLLAFAVVGSFCFFSYTTTIHFDVIRSYLSCYYYNGACLMFTFIAVFGAIFWFGYIYKKKMEALIVKIEEKSRSTKVTEETWMLKKNKNRIYSNTTIYQGPALVHGLKEVLKTVVNNV